MDFVAVAKAALELGVIPTLALFLVVALYFQNRHLTAMIEKKDAQSFEILKALIDDIAEIRAKYPRAGR